MRVLSLCDLTGNMVRPWFDAGYECTIVDVQHRTGEVRIRGENADMFMVGADVWGYKAEGRYDFGFAFPPCTDLAGSGARWWEQKGTEAYDRAVDFCLHCEGILRAHCDTWGWENPAGRFPKHSRGRRWDFTFHPYHYGGYEGGSEDGYSKRTCLWTSESFQMPPHMPIENEGSRMHLLPPNENRGNLRSATPMGFAQAVFEANERVLV